MNQSQTSLGLRWWQEHLQLSKKHVEQRVISVKDLPLKLNWEGYLGTQGLFSVFFSDVFGWWDDISKYFYKYIFIITNIYIYTYTCTIFFHIEILVTYIYIHIYISIYLWHALQAVHGESLLALSFFVGLIWLTKISPFAYLHCFFWEYYEPVMVKPKLAEEWKPKGSR